MCFVTVTSDIRTLSICYIRVTAIHVCIYDTHIGGHTVAGVGDITVRSQQTINLYNIMSHKVFVCVCVSGAGAIHSREDIQRQSI